MRSVWRAAAQLAASVLLLVALLAGAAVALAQSTDPSRPGLSATQPRVQVSLVPGAAAEGEVRFTYGGETATTGRVSVLEYRVGPEGESTSPPGEGAASWVTVNPTTVELRPNVPTMVRYRIQVPAGVTAGDHSALILVEADAAAGGGPATRAGVRLTVNVPGEVRRQADLVGFGADRQPLRLLWLQIPSGLPLFDGGPIQLRALVRNSGNVQFTTSGTIQVVDLFGNQVAAYDIPAEPVYPDDTRTFIVQWTYPPRIGWFTTRLSLDAGGTPISAEERLLILPWQAVLGALLVVLFLRLLLGRGFALPLPARRPAGEEATEMAEGREAPVAAEGSPVLIASPRAVAVGAGQSASEHTMAEDRRVADLAAAWAAKGIQDGAPLPRDEEPEPDEDWAGRLSQSRAGTNGAGDDLDVLELLRLGQQAARAGDRETAYRFFVRALKIDPDNEEAWLWRAGTAEQPQEAMRSLEQVLLINPSNVRARRGLEELQRRFAPSQG